MRPRDLAALMPRACRYAAQYLWRQRHGQPTPVVLSFLVTGRCPLRCQHCFYHYGPQRPELELDLDEYRGLAASLDDFAVGLFCGGEPFVREDLAEIIDLFRQDNHLLFPLASTNGQLTASILAQSEQLLRRRPTRPFILSFSIDGFEEQHDQIRGAGTFGEAIRCWRECQRLARHHPNLILTVTPVVSALNQHEAARFVRWLWSELSPDSVGVLLVRQTPRAGVELRRVDAQAYQATQQEALRPAHLSRLGRMAQPQLPFLRAMAAGVGRTMTTGRRSFRCHAGRHGAVIDPQGQVHACEALAEQPEVRAMGNLRSVGMSFRMLWQSRAADEARRWVGRHAVCAGCTHETMGYLPSLPFAGNRLRLLTQGLSA